MEPSDVFDGLPALQDHLYTHVINHGFEGKPIDRDLLLMISELIEGFEDTRVGKVMSEKIPEFTVWEEEIADLMIRALNFATEHELRLVEAMRAKDAYNRTRPYKHGKKF